jgi:hypothetical protein
MLMDSSWPALYRGLRQQTFVAVVNGVVRSVRDRDQELRVENTRIT